MKKFDVQDLAPDGHEVVGYRKVMQNERYIDRFSGTEVKVWTQKKESNSCCLVLKKLSWRPEVGETVFYLVGGYREFFIKKYAFADESFFWNSYSAGTLFKTAKEANQKILALNAVLADRH